MSAITDDTILQVPAWVLKYKVEDDWEEYKMIFGPEALGEDAEEFPVYDSTAKCLEILGKFGLTWDQKEESWKG